MMNCLNSFTVKKGFYRMSDIPTKIGWKPVFSSPDTPLRMRRAYSIFIAICIVVLILITWPVATLVNRGDIIIIGLPLNLFWLVLCKAIVFTCLVSLYGYEYFGKSRSTDKGAL